MYYSLTKEDLNSLKNGGREKYINGMIEKRIKLFFEKEGSYLRNANCHQKFKALENIAQAISIDPGQDLKNYKLLFHKILNLPVIFEKVYLESFISSIFLLDLSEEFFIFIHQTFESEKSFFDFFISNYHSYNVSPKILLNILKKHSNETNTKTSTFTLSNIVLIHHHSLIYRPYEDETKEIISILKKDVSEEMISHLIKTYSLEEIENWYIYNLLTT